MSAADRPPQLVTLRTDADPSIGYGHTGRCLAIAEALRARSIAVQFALGAGSDAAMLRDGGFPVRRVDLAPADLLTIHAPGTGPLLLDSPRVGDAEIDALRDAGCCLAIFGGVANVQRRAGEMMIDPSPRADAEHRGPHCCLGLRYAPLRQEFRTAFAERLGAPAAMRLLVSFGGSDPDDVTAMAVDALALLPVSRLTVLLGPGYAGRLVSGAAPPGIDLVRSGPGSIALLLASAGLFVGAAGVTALEAAAMGVPAALIRTADDQGGNAVALASAGAAVDLGPSDGLDPALLRAAVEDLLADEPRRRTMSAAGRAVVDGGGAERIVSALVECWQEWARERRIA